VNHYVLTPASRGPDYPLEANRRRIDILRGVTARSLAAQVGDWTWIAYVHPDDPLREERLDAFRSAGHPVIPIVDDPSPVIDWSGDVLTTRIDDDDAFAVGAFERLIHAAERTRSRTALLFPHGHRVYAGKVDEIRHGRNAWSSVFAPLGDRTHVRLVQHQRIAQLAPIRHIDQAPAWLWVRHQDTNSGFKRAEMPLTPAVRDLYPVDWGLLQ
jgi:hypothetical protein